MNNFMHAKINSTDNKAQRRKKEMRTGVCIHSTNKFIKYLGKTM